MTDRDDYFARVGARLDLAELTKKFVIVVGTGSVGSAIATELGMRCGVGHLALIDGDRLEPPNLSRHALDQRYLWANKADGVAEMLSAVPGIDVGALNCHIDGSFADAQLDALLHPADLIVIATDERTTQRRVSERALALDIPAVIPTLYVERGGEVFVQLGSDNPCFFCWDGFRPPDGDVRGVSAINTDALAVIQRAVYLCLAVLVPTSAEARDLAPTEQDPRLRQLFIQRPGANLLRLPLDRRDECPACRVGPSPLNGAQRRPPRRGVAAFMTARPRPSARDWSVLLRTDERPAIELFSVSETLVMEGDTVTLRWAAQNASYVEIDGIGELPTSGDREVVVTDARVFTMHAVSPRGRTTVTSDPVRVLALPTVPPVRINAVPLPVWTSRPSAPPITPRRKAAPSPPRETDEQLEPLWPTFVPPAFEFPQGPRLPVRFTARSRFPGPLGRHR